MDMKSMSIIVPTDKMNVAMSRYWAVDSVKVQDALAEIIAEIERNYVVQPRCTETLGQGMRCTRPAGHGGDVHSAILPNGSEVSFENLVDNSTGTE